MAEGKERESNMSYALMKNWEVARRVEE